VAADTWQPFGVPDEAHKNCADHDGTRILNLTLKDPAKQDRAAKWLRNAMLALALLAAVAASVSYEAQYVLVRAVKHAPVIAAAQAGIPDVGAASVVVHRGRRISDSPSLERSIR